MSLLDDIKDKAEDAVKDPDNQKKAEDFAAEHNISVDDAKAKLFHKEDDK